MFFLFQFSGAKEKASSPIPASSTVIYNNKLYSNSNNKLYNNSNNKLYNNINNRLYSNSNKVNSEGDSFSSRNQFKNVRESELNKNTYYNRNMYDNVIKNVNKDTWVNYQTTTPSQVTVICLITWGSRKKSYFF